jgi:DNA polymerase-3 subunit alpha
MREDGSVKFIDDQKIKVAGVIEALKTRPTRNDTLMAYITLDDGSGSIELLAFQRVIDMSAEHMSIGNAVVAIGRLSARDEKEPQIIVDELYPIMRVLELGTGSDEGYDASGASRANAALSETESSHMKKLYVKLSSNSSPEYERLKLILIMFPGKEQLVIHFEDTKVNVGSKCIIHDAFIKELCEMLGENNVIVK